MEVYRHGAHHGEEPPVSGSNGSGTFFFSRCTLRCLYCQNYPWSQEGAGRACSVADLAEIFVALAREGCHNWNLVSPTPWLPLIRDAWRQAAGQVDPLPVVFNTSGYERVETLREFASMIDIYLADVRYADARSAAEGSGAGDYVSAAREALAEMWRLAGPLRCGEDGVAVRGTICRVLVLPDRAGEACENLEWIASHIGTGMAVSIMAQYVPAYRAARVPGWDRRVTREEYEEVCRAVENLGFSTGWVQEYGQPAAPELLGYRMPASS